LVVNTSGKPAGQRRLEEEANMKRALAAGLFGLAMVSASSAPSAAHAGWHKAFVFSNFEPAFYYGAKDGVGNPGTDCPLGTLPDNNWKKMLKTSWRTDADVAKIMNPEGPTRQRDGGFRGPASDISVYAQPWTMPDPGIFEVSGPTAYGFDLDNNPNTGFTSPDGKVRGIDNEYYRAIGCVSTWRGPTWEGHHAKYVMETMRDGSFTVLMVVSGDGPDPDNDPNATVAFYQSRDKIVKDAMGGVTPDYTYRVEPSLLQSTVPARTVNGAIETRGPSFINIRSVDNVPMKIEQGRMRFEIKPDGSLTGFIGGYRSVNDMYGEISAGGATYELTMLMNTPAAWYALQRRADFKPNATGKNTWISMAYRYDGQPAIIALPDSSAQLTRAELVPATPQNAQANTPPRPLASRE